MAAEGGSARLPGPPAPGWIGGRPALRTPCRRRLPPGGEAGAGPAPGSRALREVVARARLAPQGGRRSALTRSARSVPEGQGQAAAAGARRGPGAGGAGGRGAQMPWSQSTSRQMYQRITYRMSRMAKMKRATRIALVTGEMSDCMAPAGRAGRGARRSRPPSAPGAPRRPRASSAVLRAGDGRPPLGRGRSGRLRAGSDRPAPLRGPRSCAQRARRPRGWAGGAGGAAAMGEDANADGGEEAARPAGPRKLGRRREGGRAGTGGSPAPRGAARGRPRAAWGAGLPGGGGAAGRRGAARGEGLRRGGGGGGASRVPPRGPARAPPAPAPRPPRSVPASAVRPLPVRAPPALRGSRAPAPRPAAGARSCNYGGPGKAGDRQPAETGSPFLPSVSRSAAGWTREGLRLACNSLLSRAGRGATAMGQRQGGGSGRSALT